MIEYIYDMMSEYEANDSTIRCSFLEIYNEQVYDLLSDNRNNLNLREDIKKGVFVEGISEFVIKDFQQALNLI